MAESQDDWFACPCCGEDVAASATFCRACGASDDSGWKSDDEWEDDFDYDEFVAREFPDQQPRSRPRDLRRAATFVIVVLVCLGLLLATIAF